MMRNCVCEMRKSVIHFEDDEVKPGVVQDFSNFDFLNKMRKSTSLKHRISNRSSLM